MTRTALWPRGARPRVRLVHRFIPPSSMNISSCWRPGLRSHSAYSFRKSFVTSELRSCRASSIFLRTINWPWRLRAIVDVDTTGFAGSCASSSALSREQCICWMLLNNICKAFSNVIADLETTSSASWKADNAIPHKRSIDDIAKAVPRLMPRAFASSR